MAGRKRIGERRAVTLEDYAIRYISETRGGRSFSETLRDLLELGIYAEQAEQQKARPAA